MEITIKKQTILATDKEWYNVFLDNVYIETFHLLEEADTYALKLMDNGGKPNKDEIIKTYKIKENAS